MSRPDIRSVFGALVQEPFFLTPQEIGRLTPYQVRHLYFRDPREKDSGAPEDLIPGYTEQAESQEKTLFWKVWKEWRGKSEEETQGLWEEHLRKKADGGTGEQP